MTFIPSYAQIDSPDPVNPQDLATKNYVDTRYAARAYRSAAFTTSSTVSQNTQMIYDVKHFDASNSYNTTTGLYTCKVAGVYVVRMSVSIGMTVAGSVSITIQLNGGTWANGQVFQTIGTTATVPNLTDIMQCGVGDTIGFWYSCSQASVAGRNVASECHMGVALLGGL